MTCCTPSGYIIISLRNLKFYEGRGPDNPNAHYKRLFYINEIQEAIIAIMHMLSLMYSIQ